MRRFPAVFQQGQAGLVAVMGKSVSMQTVKGQKRQRSKNGTAARVWRRL